MLWSPARAASPDPSLGLTPGEIVWLEQNKHTIRYFPNPNWPPGDYMEDGQHKGIVSEYIAIFEKKLGIRFQRVHYADWASLHQALMAGNGDLFGAFQKTPEREKIFVFTRPFLTTRLAVLTRTNRPSMQSLLDLNSMTVAGIQGYSSLEYVRAHYPGAHLVPCDDDLTVLLKVSAGAAEGGIVDYMMASYLVAKYGITNLKYDMELDYRWDLRFAVNRSKAPLQAILDKVLLTISEQEKQDIYTRWVGINLKLKPSFFERNRKVIIAVFLLVLGLLVAATLFNYSLQKQVDIRTRQLKANELSLQNAKNAAESANRAKSEFLANMSHEIRTPLNGVIGMLQLLKMTQLNTDQKSYIDTVLRSSERLAHLLSDILDLSRVEAGKLDIFMGPFNFNDMMASIHQLFIPLAGKKNIELQLHIDHTIPETLEGDVARLQQILCNLTGNAIKFTNSGQVEISAHRLPSPVAQGCRILFSITDTGIGISDDILARLFHPFTQAEGSYRRQFQGAGLGLAICKRLVLLMGGTMDVESEEGVGSSFSFTLPFTVPVVAQVGQEVVRSAPRADSIRVLLAEDDETSRFVARKYLEKLGHEVQTVEDGAQALARLREELFDIVFMDIQMPVLDGTEATRAIRSGEAGRDNINIPVIAMTAYTMSGDKDKFLAAGLNDYISKPAGMEQIQAAIERALVSAPPTPVSETTC